MDFVGSTRIQYKHIALMHTMLQRYSGRMRQQGFPDEARKAKRVKTALPRSLPYRLELYPHEWAILSRALRPDGSHPQAGTIEATAFSLYQMLVRKGFRHAPGPIKLRGIAPIGRPRKQEGDD